MLHTFYLFILFAYSGAIIQASTPPSATVSEGDSLGYSTSSSGNITPRSFGSTSPVPFALDDKDVPDCVLAIRNANFLSASDDTCANVAEIVFSLISQYPDQQKSILAALLGRVQQEKCLDERCEFFKAMARLGFPIDAGIFAQSFLMQEERMSDPSCAPSKRARPGEGVFNQGVSDILQIMDPTHARTLVCDLWDFPNMRDHLSMIYFMPMPAYVIRMNGILDEASALALYLAVSEIRVLDVARIISEYLGVDIYAQMVHFAKDLRNLRCRPCSAAPSALCFE